MSGYSARLGLVLVVLGLSVACTSVVAPTQVPALTAAPTDLPAPNATPTEAGTPAVPDEQALLPDPDAPATTGDTAVVSGGDFGDQADVTVESAEVVGPGSEAGQARYAFLVSITGLDELSFHYNSLNFRLIDGEDFQYEALPDGGVEPALNFGDLGPEEGARGWLTFEASAETSALQLEFSPAVAVEDVTFGFLVPR